MSHSESARWLTIEAGKQEKQYFKDLWRYRELFYTLAWRDVLVRYKQTVIGALWAILRPLIAMVVFTVIFGRLANLPSDGVPYPILVYVAMLPWQFFSSSLTESSMSLIGNANMISKIYFPRLIMPASSVIVSFADFLIAFLILIPLMAWYHFVPSIRIVALPLYIMLAFMAALGVGLWLCALTVKYRDFRFVVPFVVQFGLYVSPVGFSSSVIPAQYRLVYSLNPMVSVIDGFRWAILGNTELYLPGLLISVMTIALVSFSGLWYFRKTERTIADII